MATCLIISISNNIFNKNINNHNDAMPAASPALWWHNKLAMTAMGHRQRRGIPHIVDQRHGSETSMGNNLKICCTTSSFELNQICLNTLVRGSWILCCYSCATITCRFSVCLVQP